MISIPPAAKLCFVEILPLAVFLAWPQPHHAAGLVPYELLHTFNTVPEDGEYLFDTVTEGSDGNLYGTTVNGGGEYDGGIIFRMSKIGANYTILHRFAPFPTNGLSPWGGVIEGTDARLYGATRAGGAEEAGTVYRINRDGTDFQLIYSFTTNGSSGNFPMNSVIEGSDGRLYGRTLRGGAGNGNTIFALNKNGSGYTVLHSFRAALSGFGSAYANVIEASDGALYGTTELDGEHNTGSIFKINKNGSGFRTLYSWSTNAETVGYPEAGVCEASDGYLYGGTPDNGRYTWGTLYRIKKDGSDFRVLYDFDAYRDPGYLPVSAPIEAPGGALYGTTYYGGPEEAGTIYRINKDGTGMTWVHRFEDDGVNGIEPYASLRRGSDGAFYGTTWLGGDGFLQGSIFRIKPVELTGGKVPDGFQLRLDGFITHRYAIDNAASLGGSWGEIGTVTNQTGAVLFTHRNTTPRQGYYRCRILNP